MKILAQPWGGLGDNLQFSTLPEKFSEKNIEVFISDKKECISSPQLDVAPLF